MSTNARERFATMASRPLQEAHETLLAQSPPPGDSARWDRLADDLTVRELLSSYLYAHDSKDIPWMQSLFTEDATLHSVGAVCAGRAAIGRQYEDWNGRTRFSHRRYANPVIRFDPGDDQGWVSGFSHAVGLGLKGEARARCGRYLGRVVKSGGAWRFADWCTLLESTVFYSASVDVAALADRAPSAWSSVGPTSDAGARLDDISRAHFGGPLWLTNEPDRPTSANDKLARAVETARIRDCLIGQPGASSTRISNLMTKLSPDGREAWACYYFHSQVAIAAAPHALFGGYLARLAKSDHGWRLTDRRTFGANAGGLLFAY